MIRSSLFTKLLVTYLIVILLFLLILTGLTSLFYNRFFTDFYAHYLLSQAVQLAGILEAEGIMDEEGPVRERMINAYAGLMGSRVWLLNKEGDLLARSTASALDLDFDDKGLRPPRMRSGSAGKGRRSSGFQEHPGRAELWPEGNRGSRLWREGFPRRT